MKITLTMLKACVPCVEAYRWAIGVFQAAETDTLTYEQGMQYLLENNSPEDWIQWYKDLKSNAFAVKYYGDYEIVSQYKAYDFVNFYEEFSTLDEALEALGEYKTALSTHNPGLFACNEISFDDDGNERMRRIELADAPVDAMVRVFNPITVEFSEPLSIAEATLLLEEIKNQYFSTFEGKGLLQKIVNSEGDEAWIPYEEPAQ